jgi:Flp pilus assembly secretin CpaC
MTAMIRAVALGAALLLITITASRAEPVALRLGSGSPLLLDRAFETVLIGNPNVVEVHTRGNRSVILEPLAPGTTNLIFLDDQNIVITNIEVSVRQPPLNLIGRLP